MGEKKNVSKPEETLFESAVVNLKGNIINCQESFIQISNITQVWTGTLPKKPLPIMTLFICGALGFVCFSLIKLSVILSIAGLGLWCVVGIIIYRHNYNPTSYGLNIELNSGHCYSFLSTDHSFISNVFTVLRNIIQDNNTSNNYLINFGTGTIINESKDVTMIS